MSEAKNESAFSDQLGAGDYALEQWRKRLWELIDEYQLGHDLPLNCRDRIKEHLCRLPAHECMEIALCERHSLVLRVGQPYVFKPVGDCQSCAQAVAAAREAYGDGLGAPNVRGNAHLTAAQEVEDEQE